MDAAATITAAAPLLRSGDCTPRELVEACLAQIERYERQVHAWVWVDAEGARRTADQLAAGRSGAGPASPLWGIPLGIKDVFDLAGQPTLAGSRLRADHRAAADCSVVDQLRRAGAIILGKTVTTEFACFDPPPTRNPWRLTQTPGGSSSGSAAALALGMCLGAVGTQTGGSIIRPAAYCGVCGLKPSHGRVSMSGVVRVTERIDHAGPMARSARDLAILLDAIDRPDPKCPTFAGDRPSQQRSALQCVDDAAGAPTLGIIRSPAFDAETSQPVRLAIGEAIERLRAAGVPTIDVALSELEDIDAIRRRHRRIMAFEALRLHQATYPSRRDDYAPTVRGLLDEGTRVSAADYAEAIEHQRRLRQTIDQRWPAACTALAMPAVDATARGPETTGSPGFQSPWSYLGLPAVTIPCGLTADGLPVGLQLIGRRWEDGPLLAAAAWCEGVLEFCERPGID